MNDRRIAEDLNRARDREIRLRDRVARDFLSTGGSSHHAKQRNSGACPAMQTDHGRVSPTVAAVASPYSSRYSFPKCERM
jgi:hypothetical protein